MLPSNIASSSILSYLLYTIIYVNHLSWIQVWWRVVSCSSHSHFEILSILLLFLFYFSCIILQAVLPCCLHYQYILLIFSYLVIFAVSHLFIGFSVYYLCLYKNLNQPFLLQRPQKLRNLSSTFSFLQIARQLMIQSKPVTQTYNQSDVPER